MSTDTVKKRGRSKRASSPQEEVVAIEQPATPKPRKSNPKRQTVKDTKEPAGSLPDSTETAEAEPASESLAKRRGNGRKLEASTLANNRAAKQKAPSTEPLAILQQATAFKTTNEPTTSAHPELPETCDSEQTSIERPIEVNEAEASPPKIKIGESTPEQISTTMSTQQEMQSGSEARPAGGNIHIPMSPLSATNTATPVIEKPPASIDHRSIREPEAPMSNASIAPLPVGEQVGASGPIHKPTAASPSLNSQPPPAAKPLTTSKANPRLPLSFAGPPPSPRPPRPTELSYRELKKNPEFKALSRKYTSLFIAIPIALFTSYVLYGRYTNQMARRRIGDQVPIERNGGAKPRLLTENAAKTATPIPDMIATIDSDKRLLEE